MSAISRRRFLELTGTSALLAACAPVASAPAANPSGAAATAVAAALGKPEKTAITFGTRLPALNIQAPLYIAIDKGYFRDAGFTDVQVILTEQVLQGLGGGSLDFGHTNTLDIIAAATQQNIPIRMVSGWNQYAPVMIAVRPEIKTLADLAGKEITLGGTPGSKDFENRAGYLKNAGWDLSTVKVNAVSPPGGSDAHVKLFLDGKLAITYFFNRHRRAILASGARLLVDAEQYGSSSIAATTQSLANRPNMVGQFIWAYIRALQIWKDPANKEYVLGTIAPKVGVPVTDDIRNSYEQDLLSYRPYDAGFPTADMNELLKASFEKNTPTMSQFFDGTQLYRAQAALGFAPNPKP